MSKKWISLKKKGFTIIELMLVMSIILILTSFLVPKFSAYQKKANTAKAINAARQIQTAAMASYGDNGGKFNAEDVKVNIDTLTTASNVTVDEVNQGDQSIAINYTSDNSGYKVTVNAESNSITVVNGKTTIYTNSVNKN